MPRPDTRSQSKPDASKLRFRHQSEDGLEASAYAGVAHDGELVISPDEDPGNDPYNRTGRFERCVR